MDNSISKWKIPSWMIAGARCKVVRGRKVKIGEVGTIIDTFTTGNGHKARVHLDSTGPIQRVNPQLSYTRIAVQNLEPI